MQTNLLTNSQLAAELNYCQTDKASIDRRKLQNAKIPPADGRVLEISNMGEAPAHDLITVTKIFSKT